MSIITEDQDVVIVSHEQFKEKLYCNTHYLHDCVNLIFNSDIFNIVHPYKNDTQFHKTTNSDAITPSKDFKKRKKSKCSSTCDISFTTEADYIKSKLLQLMKSDTFKMIFNFEPGDAVKQNNAEARTASKCHFETLVKNWGVFNGKNENEYPVVVTIDGKEYVIPPLSQFYNCNVLDLTKKLSNDVKFDFIVLDPPWRNKYIRRKRKRNEDDGYNMMQDSEICSIPLAQLMSRDGLIAVWCTNSPSHLNALIAEIFPAWDVKYISTWFWFKVTKMGKPVCEFSEPPGKQPYERIVFGCRSGRSQFYKQPENNKIVVSVPSAIHSHKPPLIDLLKEYLDDKPKCLELFARYLLPGWVSCGNQVLSLQNINLYNRKQTEVSSDVS